MQFGIFILICFCVNLAVRCFIEAGIIIYLTVKEGDRYRP